MRLALAGPGAFGIKHLEALTRIGCRVETLVSVDAAHAEAVAARFGIPRRSQDLDSVLRDEAIDAVILCTPTPLHASQAMACLRAGKHVLVEIPLADSLPDAQSIVALAQRQGCIAMCGHTRRFNPGHQWLNRLIQAGRFQLQHLVVQTYFMRRTNINALGQPRGWTDHLLWHHAAHSVDLFLHQTRSSLAGYRVLQGPIHPQLGIATDMSIQMASRSGALCTLSLSFNNDGPLGSDFRYIGDSGTYLARYDELLDGHGRPVDLDDGAPSDGVERQDREFLAAIRERRQPQASAADVLPCYEVLAALERVLRRR
nr:Gfo/Idh/MocA family oxidoreductase [Nevskia soli]